MKKMLNEFRGISEAAKRFQKESAEFRLPENIPYLGMGSSYFAPLAFYYMGLNIFPEIASEYYHYVSPAKIAKNAVILSQSGNSSEAVWCTELFDRYAVITNNPDGALCKSAGAEPIIDILAGEEQYSSSKTYVNTLLALFKGFGINVTDALLTLEKKMLDYEAKGREMAIQVYSKLTKGQLHGFYILGSGPNLATALEASLILSESTKRCFTGLALAQYDHGPKETSGNSMVINIVSPGKNLERAVKLNKTIAEAGAEVIVTGEEALPENLSILVNIIPFNFMAFYLAELLGIEDTFVVGGKVTTTEK